MTDGPNTPPPPGGNPPPPGNTPPPPGSGGPPQQSSFASAQVGQPADLGMRILAKLIDGVLLGVVYGVLVIPITAAIAFSGGFGLFSMSGIITNVISAAIFVGYFTIMESQWGKTVGKMVLKLEVQGPDGKHPQLDQAFKRNAYFLLAIIPFLGWLLQLAAMIYLIVTINNTPSRQGWHDNFADGTKVIRVG